MILLIEKLNRGRKAAHQTIFIAGLMTALLLSGGWLVNRMAGVDTIHRLAVGTHAEISKEDGLAIVLQRRIDDYGPADIRLKLQDRTSGKMLGVLEIHEKGGEVSIPGHDLQVNFERFDDIGREFFVELKGAGKKGERVSFAIDSKPWQDVFFGDYVLTLASYRLPPDDLHVRAKVELLESGNLSLEVWLEKGHEVHWQGYGIQMLGWEIAGDGSSQVLIQVRKNPGRIFYWLAPLPLCVLGMVFFIRRKGTFPEVQVREIGSDAARKRHRFFLCMGLLSSFLILEAGAIVIEWSRDRLTNDRSLYFDMKNPVPAFELAVENGVKVYRRTSHHRLLLGGQSFLQDKPVNGYRVFILGGSAASGWPYEIGDFNISHLLEKKLKIAYPDKIIEVINAAGGTYGSHRVRLLFDELIEYQPDLIVLYSGNNEFLENFVFRRSLLAPPWKYSATIRLGYDLYRQFDNFKPEYHVDSYTVADQTTNRIAYAFGKVSPYRSDPEQFEQIKEHYRDNLSHIVGTARKRGVQSVILNVPVNLKDWIPNSSRHTPDLPLAALKLWQENFRNGYERLESKDYAGAIKFLSQAVAIDDEHAETHYYLGVARLRRGELEAAKESFNKALERDAYPFRALPQFQKIIQDLSLEEQVPLVDAVGALEAQTTDRIIGLDVLLDYVHPKESSQEIIAQQIMQTLFEKGFLPQPPGVPLDALRIAMPTNFRPLIEAQAIESIYGQNLIMRQYDKLDQVYQAFVATMQRAKAADPAQGSYYDRSLATIEAIHPIVMAYREVLWAEKLGMLEQRFSHKDAENIYTRYVDMIQALEAPEMSRQAFLLQVPKLDFDGAGQ